ncbi:MAG: ABC transporter permease [Candidatus Puniceispirillaceae bacterium]
MIWVLLSASLVVFSAPVIIGVVGVILPAAGFFPPLGHYHLSFDPLILFFTNPAAYHGIITSLMTGLIASFLSVFFVFALMSFGAQGGVGSHLMRLHRRLMGPLIALPHATIAIALLFLLAPSGFLVRLISPELTGWTRPPAFGFVPDQTGWLLIIGLMVKEIPFLLFIALAQSQRLAITSYQQVGMSFGYQPVVVWAFGIWPQIYRQMRLPILAVLAYSLSVVDMALILGPTLPPPLSVLVLQGFHDADLQIRLPASAGALIQILIILAGVGTWFIGEKIVRFLMRLALSHGLRLRGFASFIGLCFLLISAVFLLLCIGLFAIGLWAFANRWSFGDKWPGDFGLRYWHSQALSGSVVTDSILIACLASFICVAVAAFWLEWIARDKRAVAMVTAILFTPLFVPQISLLFGLQVALSWSYLDGRIGTVIFVHCLYILPYVWLVLAPAYEAHDERYMQLGHMMGYRRLQRFWKIRLPMLAYSFGSAVILGFAVSFALYVPSVFSGAGQITTLTMEAVTQAASGSRGATAQAAFLQMALPFICFLLVRLFLQLRFGRYQSMQAHKHR